ncbi:MAG: hypothetical protein WCX84_05390 [Syntrophales bacterium]|jgi:cobalamin-dependent methionine synthase I|nr:hypothetical protein [Syntrophales bacterium]
MVFHTIRITPPVQKIYRRLGYRRDITHITPQQEQQVDQHIDEALALIQLRGVMTRLPICGREDGSVILGRELRLETRHLARFLRDCDEALLLGATAGEAVMAAIRADMAADAVARAVVFDATASEMAEGALDWLMDYARRDLVREGKVLLDRRFSSGYGDFALENQPLLYTVLKMQEIGVAITPEYLLLPEKSVTAVTGIRKNLSP